MSEIKKIKIEIIYYCLFFLFGKNKNGNFITVKIYHLLYFQFFFFFFCFGKYKNIGILKKLDFKKLSILFIRLIKKKKIKQALSIPKKERGILQYLYKFGYGNPKVNWLHLTQISLSSNFNVFKIILFYFSLLF